MVREATRGMVAPWESRQVHKRAGAGASGRSSGRTKVPTSHGTPQHGTAVGHDKTQHAAQPEARRDAAPTCGRILRVVGSQALAVPPMVPRSLRAGPSFGSCASRTCLLLLPLRHVCLRSRLRATPGAFATHMCLKARGKRPQRPRGCSSPADLGPPHSRARRRAAQAETTPEAHMTKW